MQKRVWGIDGNIERTIQSSKEGSIEGSKEGSIEKRREYREKGTE